MQPFPGKSTMKQSLQKSEGGGWQTAAGSRSSQSFPWTQDPKSKTEDNFTQETWGEAKVRLAHENSGGGGAFASPCLTLPHFSGLHTLSAVVPRVHKGHLADAPRLCDPYVLAAVTVARDDLIHLKHTWFSVTSLHGAWEGERGHLTFQWSWYFTFTPASLLLFIVLKQEHGGPCETSSYGSEGQAGLALLCSADLRSHCSWRSPHGPHQTHSVLSWTDPYHTVLQLPGVSLLVTVSCVFST